jgi:hypothetical protein
VYRDTRTPDFTAAEAQKYLIMHMQWNLTLADEVIDKVGTRAFDLSNICDVCASLNDDKAVLQAVDSYCEFELTDAVSVLSSFMKRAALDNDLPPAAAADQQAFLRQLSSNTSHAQTALTVQDATLAFAFADRNSLLRALAEYHAFVVDPFTHRIEMQSHFMRQAIEQYLEKLKPVQSSSGSSNS